MALIRKADSAPEVSRAEARTAQFAMSPTPDAGWRLVDKGLALPREHEIESIFTVANGYLGAKGSLCEGCSLSDPATFLAGVYVSDPETGGPALATIPDWIHLLVHVEGNRLCLAAAPALEHRRVLDLRKGVLWRRWRHLDPAGRITRLEAVRLACLTDPHLLVQLVKITAENYAGRLSLEATLGEAPGPGGPATAVPPAGLRWRARFPPGEGRAVSMLGTGGRGVTVGLAMRSQLRAQRSGTIGREVISGAQGVVEKWEWRAALGESALFQRLVAVHTSREILESEGEAVRRLERVSARGVKRVLAAHVAGWESKWRSAEVGVEGDPEAQKALRFALYHLISAGAREEGVSIGARALTGRGYQGHIFWDTEIYLMPFYIFTDPPAARCLLQYRYRTLPAAKEKARRLGYRGALYAWESADTGEETTPTSVVAPNGALVRVRTGEEEHHSSGDVAYAVWQYWKATGDDSFLLEGGAEILLETARFWASRGRIEADGRYHIRRVIGPDEYHESVNDNAYTNVLAQWNLERGAEVARVLATRWPDHWRLAAPRLGIAPGEPEKWRRLAEAMAINLDPPTGILEQFEGYSGLAELDLRTLPPRVPIELSLGRERTQRLRVTKQADVVALSVLFWDRFPREVHEANFRYYEPRTAHGSSLSPSFHALVAARLGDHETFERYFRQSAEIDLADNMGNAAAGVHIGALGGLWQATVLGVAGLRLREGGLALDPQLPPAWKKLSFPVRWQGREVSISITAEPPRVTAEVRGSAGLFLELPGAEARLLAPGKRWIAQGAPAGWNAWEESP